MSRLTWVFALVAVLGWGAAYILWKRPTPQPQTIVQTVDKIETKVVYRETSKPDGTVVKETVTTKKDVKTKTDSRLALLPKTKWMLGAQVFPTLTDKISYGGEIGYRIGDSPTWIKIGYNSRQELTLGLLLEF